MSIESKIQSISQNRNMEWEPPVGYDLGNNKDAAVVEDLLDRQDIKRVVDPIDQIADDTFELRYPNKVEDNKFRSEFIENIKDQGVCYGRWFHFPWSETLVRYPDSQDHFELRTYRNQPLVTKEEQKILYNSSIATFGLSVGSNINDMLIQSAVGNEHIIADFDTLTPTNLNRIRAAMGYVGLKKTVIAGRKISEVDPYVSQHHLSDGYDGEADNALRENPPDIIVEEVDDLSVKARVRRIASELGIPLIMVGDIGERSIVDVERYDLGDTKPFNGKLSKTQYEDLLSGDVTKKDQEGMLIKLNGLRNLSPRLIESAMMRGVDIAGFPQLGTTATAGAALANIAIREILLDRKMESGTYVQSPKNSLKIARPTTLRQDIDTLRRFAAYRKQSD